MAIGQLVRLVPGRVFTRRFEVEKSPAGFGDFLVVRKRFCLRMLRATRRA